MVGIMTYQRYKNRNILARSNCVLSIISAINKNDDSDSDDSKSVVTAKMVPDRTLSMSIPSGDDINNDDEDKSAVTATTMVSDRTLSISIPSGDDDINNDTSDDELSLSSD